MWHFYGQWKGGGIVFWGVGYVRETPAQFFLGWSSIETFGQLGKWRVLIYQKYSKIFAK